MPSWSAFRKEESVDRSRAGFWIRNEDDALIIMPVVDHLLAITSAPDPAFYGVTRRYLKETLSSSQSFEEHRVSVLTKVMRGGWIRFRRHPALGYCTFEFWASVIQVECPRFLYHGV